MLLWQTMMFHQLELQTTHKQILQEVILLLQVGIILRVQRIFKVAVQVAPQPITTLQIIHILEILE